MLYLLCSTLSDKEKNSITMTASVHLMFFFVTDNVAKKLDCFSVINFSILVKYFMII